MAKDGIREGLVGVLTGVEPWRSFCLRQDAPRKRRQLVAGPRKCLHVYYYFADRELGLRHVRVQPRPARPSPLWLS